MVSIGHCWHVISVKFCMIEVLIDLYPGKALRV